MTCSNCSAIFSATAFEKRWYEKFKLPRPSLCFDCRMQRKMAFRNERTLYSRNCDLCKREVVSMYEVTAPFPVFCPDCWYSDRWDGTQYGRPVDFSRPFLDQVRELHSRIPHMSLTTVRNENCSYTNWVDESVNCYMLFSSTRCEDTHYSEMLVDCRTCIDCTSSSQCEECYFCVDVHKSYNVLFSRNIHSSHDIAFSFDLVNCHNCLFSYNQRYKQYLIENVQYPPDQWERKMNEILSSPQRLDDAWKKFIALMEQDAIHKFTNLTHCEHVEGDNLHASTRAYNSFDSAKLEDCANIIYGDEIKDCYDSFAIVNGSEECYEAFSYTGVRRGLFSIALWHDVFDVQYSYNCVSSQHLFGCAGLKNAKYAILNKVYGQKEYDALIKRIVNAMQQHGEYGEFFSVPTSPFAYNETIAANYYPLSKNEVLKRGWHWKDDLPGSFGQETVDMNTLPHSTKVMVEAITDKILACRLCKKNYKCIPQEIAFYQRHRLPLPDLCHNCRHLKRLQLRNPRKLWPRSCMCTLRGHTTHHDGPCTAQFKTTYAPEQPEKVFDESCYRETVI